MDVSVGQSSAIREVSQASVPDAIWTGNGYVLQSDSTDLVSDNGSRLGQQGGNTTDTVLSGILTSSYPSNTNTQGTPSPVTCGKGIPGRGTGAAGKHGKASKDKLVPSPGGKHQSPSGLRNGNNSGLRLPTIMGTALNAGTGVKSSPSLEGDTLSPLDKKRRKRRVRKPHGYHQAQQQLPSHPLAGNNGSTATLSGTLSGSGPTLSEYATALYNEAHGDSHRDTVTPPQPARDPADMGTLKARPSTLAATGAVDSHEDSTDTNGGIPIAPAVVTTSKNVRGTGIFFSPSKEDYKSITERHMRPPTPDKPAWNSPAAAAQQHNPVHRHTPKGPVAGIGQEPRMRVQGASPYSHVASGARASPLSRHALDAFDSSAASPLRSWAIPSPRGTPTDIDLLVSHPTHPLPRSSSVDLLSTPAIPLPYATSTQFATTNGQQVLSIARSKVPSAHGGEREGTNNILVGLGSHGGDGYKKKVECKSVGVNTAKSRALYVDRGTQMHTKPKKYHLDVGMEARQRELNARPDHRLVSIESMLDQELESCRAPYGPDQERLSVFHACFEKVIAEFPLAAKLLGRIKTEYDLNIRHGDSALEKLGAMHTKAAASEDRIRVLERKLEGLARHLASEVKTTRQLRSQLDQAQGELQTARRRAKDVAVPDDLYSDTDSLVGTQQEGTAAPDGSGAGKPGKHVTLQTPKSSPQEPPTTTTTTQQSTPSKVAHTISDYDEVDSGLDLTNEQFRKQEAKSEFFKLIADITLRDENDRVKHEYEDLKIQMHRLKSECAEALQLARHYKQMKAENEHIALELDETAIRLEKEKRMRTQRDRDYEGLMYRYSIAQEEISDLRDKLHTATVTFSDDPPTTGASGSGMRVKSAKGASGDVPPVS